MKYEMTILNLNDVAYLVGPYHTSDGVQHIRPSIRIENINGDLYESSLPEYFVIEEGAIMLDISKDKNLYISSGPTYDDIIIKQEKKSGIIGMTHYNRKNGFERLPATEYINYMIGVASSKFNPRNDYTNEFHFEEQQYKLLRLCMLSEDLFYDYNYTAANRILHQALAKQRKFRIDYSKEKPILTKNEENFER